MSVSDLGYPGNAAARPTPLAAPTADVELWWCALENDDEALATFSRWLSQAERARARRFSRPALARRYVAGRAALRWLLARHANREPADVEIVRGPRGRPQSPGGPDFNVSNTANVALVGVCTRPGWRIGVDVEHGHRVVDHHGLARKFLTPRERTDIAPLDDDEHRRAFLRLWTCKEAMSKATGDALSAPMRAMTVECAPSLRLVDGPAPYRPQAWTLFRAAAPDPFIATVALWEPGIV